MEKPRKEPRDDLATASGALVIFGLFLLSMVGFYLMWNWLQDETTRTVLGIAGLIFVAFGMASKRS